MAMPTYRLLLLVVEFRELKAYKVLLEAVVAHLTIPLRL
jgi:hypothetical protein